jgi:hypothetical protein
VILEDILAGEGHNPRKVAFALSELLEPGSNKKHGDDIRVRAYVVRAHWRKRWQPKPGYLTARKNHLKVVRQRA